MLALVLAQSPNPISVGWQNDLFSFGLIILIGLNIWDKFKRKSMISPLPGRRS